MKNNLPIKKTRKGKGKFLQGIYNSNFYVIKGLLDDEYGDFKTFILDCVRERAGLEPEDVIVTAGLNFW